MLTKLVTFVNIALRAHKFISQTDNELKERSLTQFAEQTRIEPITIISKDLIALPELKDINSALVSIYTGYYLQALTLQNADQRSINIINQLSTNRTANLPDILESKNNQSKVILDGPDVITVDDVNKIIDKFPGMESNAVYIPKGLPKIAGSQSAGLGANVGPTPAKGSTENVIGESSQIITCPTSLAIGKVFDIEVGGSVKYKITMSCRLKPVPVDTSIICQAYEKATMADTDAQRKLRIKTGELDFWKDGLMCNDLIDHHRKTLLKDDTGFYRAVSKRRINHLKANLAKGVGLNTASNILVLSSSTARQLEGVLGGKLSVNTVRNQLFVEGGLILLVVYNPDTALVTMYHRGTDLPTTVTVRELQIANKGTGMDVGEILRAYQLGQPPRF